MSCNIDESAVIILAAGSSGRMGFHKPLLHYNDDESFLEHIFNVYTEADIGQVVLIASSSLYEVLIRKDFEFLKQITLVLNAEPEQGRLFSVKMGVENTMEESYCFIQNIDEPFVDVKLIQNMASKVRPKAYSQPYMNEHGGHPVLMSPEICRDLKTTAYKDVSLKDFLASYQRIEVPVKKETYFININTVADYKSYFRREPSTV